jgi:ferredoxin--NADP+ reductase
MDSTTHDLPETSHAPPTAEEVRQLRAKHYNAGLASVALVHADLAILRIVPDGGVPDFEPGQFLSLGLGNWEPRVAGVDEEHDDLVRRRMIKRAYSISCSLLDAERRLRRATDFPYLEFYVALVRHAEKKPPALTPRLFALAAGDRLFVESRPAGHYTLQAVAPDDDVFLFATGTGEAPHNTMVAELLRRGHRGRIVSAVSVRYRADAAYRAAHEELIRRHGNYRSLVLTTREPENLDPARPDYVGKLYLQDIIRSGGLERECGVALDPARSQVFLCGNPAMIGAPRHAAPGAPAAEPGSMLELLLARGFRPAQPGESGNVHFERYW